MVVGFPDTNQLELTAEAAFGADLTADPSAWAWTTLTCTHPSNPSQTISRLLNTPITIKKGIAVGGSNQQTTSATLQLLNHDGALTPELVTSPYWPYVDAGTPMRLRLRTNTSPIATDTFGRTTANGWGTSDSGHLWVNSGTAADWSTTGTQARLTQPTVGVIRRALLPVTFLSRDIDVTYDSAMAATATGAPCAVGAVARYIDNSNHLWCATEFTTAGTIILRARVVVAADFTTVLASASTGVAYTPGAVIRTRVQIVGDRIRMMAWPAANPAPTTWHIDVRQTTYTAPGRAGLELTPHVGNTNTPPVLFNVDNFSLSQPPYDRVEGYIVDVRPRFEPQPDGSTWSTVLVDIGGIGSRLEKRQSPSLSPMRRSVQLAPVTPVGYWPLEDAEGSTFGASAYPGGPQMLISGPAVFAFSAGTPTEQYLSKYGTKPMVSIAAGVKLTAVVPLSAVQDEWAVSFIGEFFAPGVPLSEMRVCQWETPSGTHNRWALIALGVGGYKVRAYQDATGSSTDVVSYPTNSFLRPTYTVEAHQNGANIDVELFVNDISIGTGSIASTQAAVSRVTFNPDKVNVTGSVDPFGIKFIVGHARVVDEVTVHDTPYYDVPETGTRVSASTAWYQEPAHRRLERLCDEERVPFQFVGDPETTGMTILNAQQDGGFSELTTAATEAESGGLLYEHRFGYEYLPRSARYNQSPALVIDMATYGRSEETDPGDVLVPQLDSRAANYWTISRTGGGSGSWAADAAYRERRGTIAEERTLDVLTDDVLTDHAAWRVHLGVDGMGAKYPSVPVDLAANPGLIEAFLAVGIGSRVQRLNQPTIAGAGTIDQVVDGITETLSPTSWDVVLAASPGTVWDVGVYDDPNSRFGPANTTLSAPGLNSTALSFIMSGEPWQTGAVSLLLTVDGEDIAVSNITGSGNGPYTVTATARSVNGLVAAHLAGAAITRAVATRWAL